MMLRWNWATPVVLAGLSVSFPHAHGEGEIVIIRQVPPRIAYREAPPGPAVSVEASPRRQVYDALELQNGRVGSTQGLLVGQELSEAEIAAISSSIPHGNDIGGPVFESLANPSGGAVSPLAQGAAGARTGLSGIGGGAAAGITRTTGALANTIRGVMAPLGKP